MLVGCTCACPVKLLSLVGPVQAPEVQYGVEYAKEPYSFATLLWSGKP